MNFLVLVLVLAAPPTPGPLEKAGAAADRAVRRVAQSVADALLEGKVKVALLQHLKGEAMAIEVEAKEGTVTLSGKVEERATPMVAGRVAGSVQGVVKVVNKLQWTPTTGERPGKLEEAKRLFQDQLLEGRVKVRLLEELGRTAFAIEVEARSSVVVLSGTVGSWEKRKLAVAVAESTPGVRKVHDLLRVAR
ncbi:MAG: BON domain-containing protein [Thermoanaerobaculaceae bacterium]